MFPLPLLDRRRRSFSGWLCWVVLFVVVFNLGGCDHGQYQDAADGTDASTEPEVVKAENPEELFRRARAAAVLGRYDTLLGLKPSTLQSRMKKLGVVRDSPR